MQDLAADEMRAFAGRAKPQLHRDPEVRGYHKLVTCNKHFQVKSWCSPQERILVPDACLHSHRTPEILTPSASPQEGRPALSSNHRAFYVGAAGSPSNCVMFCWERIKFLALSYDEMEAKVTVKVHLLWLVPTSPGRPFKLRRRRKEKQQNILRVVDLEQYGCCL